MKSQLFIMSNGNYYTEVEVPRGKYLEVPMGWVEKPDWSWQDAQENGYVYIWPVMAGFFVKDSFLD